MTRLGAIATYTVNNFIGAAVPASTITSLTIMGPSPLLDATNDYSDATARIGVNGNGWVAKAVMPYLALQNFDPTKISIVVSDAGFSAANVTASRTRTIRGGRVLRRQYAAQTSKQQSNNGIDFTVYFSLIGDNAEFATVYDSSTSTLVSATAATNFYGGAAAGTIAGLVNSSTRAAPAPLTAWVTRQHDFITGNFDVEAAVYHKHGAFGQMVAGVRFWAEDSQGTPNSTPNVDTNAPVLSTVMTQGFKPEVYKATLSPTNLTQADLCFVYMIVYPWVGPAWSLKVNRADPGATIINTLAPMVPLRVLNDKSVAWTGAHAAVKVGAAGPGSVQATRALAEQAANQFQTIAAALAALPAWNNTNKGHNTHDGSTVWLLDDGGVDIEHSTSGIAGGTATSGKCWTIIKPSPSNTAVASVKIDGGVTYVPPLLSWEANVRQVTTNAFYGNAALTPIAYRNCTLTWVSTGFGQTLGYQQLPIQHNVTVGGQFLPEGYHVGTLMTTLAQSSDRQSQSPCAIGSRFYRTIVYEDVNTLDGRVFANNQYLGMTAGGNSIGLGNAKAVVKGIAFVQNVVENYASTNPNVTIAGDSSSVAVDNILNIYNTLAGGRSNTGYADVAAAAGVLKYLTSRFNLNQQVNSKSDMFGQPAQGTGRVGNWAYINGVDRWELSLKPDAAGNTTTGDGYWNGELWANPQHINVGVANVTFTLDASNDGTNVGNGTYTLTGVTNAAYNGIPANKAALKFDMAGIARLNNGTGAFGAYERTL
jgi:hypothetical protein